MSGGETSSDDEGRGDAALLKRSNSGTLSDLFKRPRSMSNNRRMVSQTSQPTTPSSSFSQQPSIAEPDAEDPPRATKDTGAPVVVVVEPASPRIARDHPAQFLLSKTQQQHVERESVTIGPDDDRALSDDHSSAGSNTSDPATSNKSSSRTRIIMQRTLSGSSVASSTLVPLPGGAIAGTLQYYVGVKADSHVIPRHAADDWASGQKN